MKNVPKIPHNEKEKLIKNSKITVFKKGYHIPM